MRSSTLPALSGDGLVLAERRGSLGLITLNRPQALNALSLSMVRDLTALLLAWRDDASVQAVLVRGATQEGKGAAFCAGGDIRFFHQAALAGDTPWAAENVAVLRKRSPLMLAVTLEQVRRARRMTLAEDLRMERDLVRHCFHLGPGTASETVEGIRALAVDKDHAPRWNPARIEEVAPETVRAFFTSPWPAHAHPLNGLR